AGRPGPAAASVAAAPAPTAVPVAAPPAPAPEPESDAIPSVGKLAAIPAKKAAEVCKLFELSDEVKPVLRPDWTPGQLLFLLIEKRWYEDAVRFLAHALPKREAVWWAWQCARTAAGASPSPQALAALAAVEQWVKDPSENNRQAALDPAAALEFGTAAGGAALGAFRSSGYYGPTPFKAVVPPDESLTAQAVVESVLSAVE